jgi:hypothetical protein
MLAHTSSFLAALRLRNKCYGWVSQRPVLNKDVAPAWHNTAAVYNGSGSCGIGHSREATLSL